MLPEYPEFKRLGIEDHELLAAHLAQVPRATCDLSLTNLRIWRECESPSITFVNGNLCILIESHNEPRYFLEPLGENNLMETLRTCLHHAGRVSRAGETFVRKLSEKQLRIAPLRDHFDYIYEVRSLSELRGKKFDGKRNQIRKFSRNHPQYKFVPLTPGHGEVALWLFDRWSRERENGNGASVAGPPASHVCQRRAIEAAFGEFGRLGLRGGAILVENQMEGFILASAGGGGMATAHLQYANYRMPGIYQILLWETCRNILFEFELLNLEEDLGIPGLRKTKLSYQPLRLEKKYLITCS
jgi:hypothetical protein